MDQYSNLNSVHLHFDAARCSYHWDEAAVNRQIEKMKLLFNDRIYKIWTYVLSFTPNLLNYSFSVDFASVSYLAHKPLNHLIGHYDQLQSLTIPTPTMLEHITSNIVSLRKLIILAHSAKSFNNLIANNHLKHFPNLESFAFIFEKRLRAFDMKIDENLNESVVQLFEYLLEQRPPKLQYITLCNQDCVGTAKRIAKHASSGKDFDCDKEISRRICKLIVAMATSKDIKIKTITLSPVILRKDELEYLEFWFANGFGAIDMNVYTTKHSVVNLMDITITNRINDNN